MESESKLITICDKITRARLATLFEIMDEDFADYFSLKNKVILKRALKEFVEVLSQSQVKINETISNLDENMNALFNMEPKG